MSRNLNEERQLWEFGGVRLDGRARLLLKDGIPVQVTPKALDVLLYLARNAGRAVTREELLDALWPDAVVTDASLTQAVFLIRKALGETDASEVLETVPRVGYRLNLPVQAASPAPAASAEAPANPVEPAVPVRPIPNVAGEGAFPSPSEAEPAPQRRKPSAAVLGLAVAGTLAAAAIGSILVRSPARGGPEAPVPAPPPPLLALEREIPVPPDALRVLGEVEGAFVLSAPSAFYLLPADGALAASRVPLAPGEVLAAPLGGERLLLVRGGRVVARHPSKPEETDLGPLPADAPRAEEGRVAASRSGRYLGLRGPQTWEVFERTRTGWARRLRARVPYVAGEVLDLGERLAALAQGGGGPVRAWSLPEGAPLLAAPFAERQLFALAVDDARGQVAAAGPFDSVAVFATEGPPGPRLLPRRGRTYGLAWVADGPTLLASGLEGIAAWRGDATEPLASLSTVSPGGALFSGSDALLALVPRRQRLAVVSYSGHPPSARISAGGRPLWAVQHDAAGETVFAGGRDGHLWVLDAKSLGVRREDAHTDGVPSLARDGDLLASSSDDKTVALWKLPGPALLSRTKAHDFLVNDLAVVEGRDGRELVTSSSDGTATRWAWPALDLLEKVDAGALLGRPASLHAVWPAPGTRRILAGTWNGSLLDLTFREGRWTVREHPVPSRAVYRLAPLPRLGLVVAAGIHPASLHVFDLPSGTLRPLDAAGLDVLWVVPVPGRDEVVVVGLNGVSRYAFSTPLPDATGRRSLAYRVWSRRQTGAGLQTATLLPDGSLWAGTVRGELVRFDGRGLDGPPLLARTVELGPAR